MVWGSQCVNFLPWAANTSGSAIKSSGPCPARMLRIEKPVWLLGEYARRNQAAFAA